MKHSIAIALAVIFAAHIAPACAADETVVGSPHDFSSLSPNSIRSLTEDRVCVFCHVPHTSEPQAQAWRRDQPRVRYRIYQSSTTDARIDQPSGVSKMCLGCHDGLLALGMSANLPVDPNAAADNPIVMTRRFLPPGRTNLTNDLRDDHPICFRYDRALSRRDAQLRSPDLVSRTLPMGPHHEVHCTACHDPHNNRQGDFLHITERRGALCVTCHDLNGWERSAHANSPRPTVGRSVDPTERLKYSTVGDNACGVCHKVHTAPKAERLLRFPRSADNCINCHDGTGAGADILSEIRKTSGHADNRRADAHDAAERSRAMRVHVTCVDCHNPHAAQSSRVAGAINIRGPAPAPADGTLAFVKGVSASGREVAQATFAYEICFRCHADQAGRTRSQIIRQSPESNTRLEFQLTNPSFHPVLGPRRNPDVVSLVAPFRSGVVIECTDCHNSDNSPRVGGSGPDGPHGSRFSPLLAERYDTSDFTIESAQAYGLCYRCHDRTSILRDDSFQFHRLHVVVARTPCSACHDPHGVRGAVGGGSSTNLINFDLSIVRPVRTGGGLQQPRFVDTGRRSGNCTMTCHGVDHVGTAYGTAAGGGVLGAILGGGR